MSRIRPSTCAEPGPGDAHCTDYPLHDYSCYDAGDDVSFNHRHDFRHDCDDPACLRQHFTNVGDWVGNRRAARRVWWCVRDIDVVDSELRLIAAVRAMCREGGRRPPSIAPADDLLDERAEAVAHAGGAVEHSAR